MKDQKVDKKDSGLTLVELIIVMIIIFTAGAIAMPSFQRYAINSNLRSATRDLAADFASLKGRAMAENAMHRIVLNTAQNTYDLQQCANPGSPCGAWNVLQTKNLSLYGSDIVFNAASTTVTNYTFQTRGTVSMGTIVMNNGRGSSGTITVNITGRTSVSLAIQ